MNRKVWCSLLLAVASCGGSAKSVTDCPSYVVTPDAGVTGFTSIGEWRTDTICAQYCQPDYPVCQLATATSVKCQKGCG
ncbi:MAG: hypothetical protein ACJ8F1_12760 [Polyangia bacterium]